MAGLEGLTLHPTAPGATPFADDDFCGARALFRDRSRPPAGHPAAADVRWLRPAEVCAEAGAPTPALFVNSSSSSDVMQGRLGDCWFLSALGVVALQPTLLARVFRRWDEAAAGGRCTLVFHHEGEWRAVTVSACPGHSVSSNCYAPTQSDPIAQAFECDLYYPDKTHRQNALGYLRGPIVMRDIAAAHLQNAAG